MEKGGYAYIMASKGKRLYVGVTSELRLRVKAHKKKAHPNSHTARYNIDQLVYYEAFETINEAIARESTIKNMNRIEKIQLIVAMNPDCADLSLAWDKPAKPFDESRVRPPAKF